MAMYRDVYASVGVNNSAADGSSCHVFDELRTVLKYFAVVDSFPFEQDLPRFVYKRGFVMT